jgi:hypothetical protein
MREVPVLSFEINPGNALDGQNTGYCAGSEAALADLTRQLLTQPLRLRQLALAARAHATRRHSLANAADLIRVFDTVLA